MDNKRFIYRVLNLEEGEGLLVSLPIIYSFFAGASLAFFVTSSTSLFLNMFERDMLSVAFIAAGVIVWIVGQAFSKVQKKVVFTKSLTYGLAFLLVSILIFTAFFIGSKPLVIIFIIYAWVRVFAYIHAVTFWGMAGRLFSLRQGKRVFGLISGGEVLASILAFFSVPFLLKIISTEDLLFISGISLLIGFFVMMLIVKKFKEKLIGKQTDKNKGGLKKPEKKTTFLQSKYYKLFFVVAFIPIFAQFFVDFIFQAQAKLEYTDKASLTAFVGVFFGISSIVEFFLKTFISGRLLSRYGMKLGLLAFPVVLAFSFVLATSFGFIYGAASLFFSFVALGRLFTRAVRTSFNDPATQVLYQPLPPEERIAFQNKVESGPKAYASIVAGILLFLFAKIPGFSLVHFSAFLLLVIALWYKSASAIYKEYRTVLQSILSKKNGKKEADEEAPLIELLKKSILNGGSLKSDTLARFYRLVLPYQTDKYLSETEKLSADVIAQKVLKFSRVIELSKSEETKDRIIAARNMTKYSIYKIEKPIIRLLHDEDFDVKCEAIIATGKMKESELFYHLVSLFQNDKYKNTVSAAMINIGEAIVPELDHNFQKTEYNVLAQLKTVELVEKIGGEKSLDFLRKNINHHNKLVSDRIIEAIGNLNYRAERNEISIVWQKIEKEIKNYVSITSAILNIGKIGEKSSLYKALETEQSEKKKKIFSHLSVLYDPQAVKLISENTEAKDKDASGFALEIADMVFSEMHKPMLLPLLESQFNFEIVSKYMLYFPTEKMSVSEQLIDLINSEYWVTGYYTKCCAIKMLTSLKGFKHSEVLIANMVHPNVMIRQLASFYLYQHNNELFFKEVNQNFPKVDGLMEFSTEIEFYVNGKKRLVFDKLLDLKKLSLFKNVHEEELIELAASLKEINLDKDEILGMEPGKTDLYIVRSGEIIDPEGVSLSQDAVFSLYFEGADVAKQYKIVSGKARVIQIEMHFISSLFVKNIDFAEIFVRSLMHEQFNKKSTVLAE